jgi:protein SCO1/2
VRIAQRFLQAWPALLGVVLLLTGCAGASDGHPAPPIQLTNQFGEVTRLEDLRGRTVILTFLYTSCPDTCPLYLSKIALGLRSYEDATGDRPVVVVVTVDPDRDSVARLRMFASQWPAGWLFLTGTYPRVSRVWNAYRIDVSKRPPAGLDDVAHGYSVTHTAKVLTIDRQGLIRATLTGDWSPADLSEALQASSVPSSAALVSIPPLDLGWLLRRCGDFAAEHPAVFLGLVLLTSSPVLLLTAFFVRMVFGPARHQV